jgi:hypothetical protein
MSMRKNSRKSEFTWFLEEGGLERFKQLSKCSRKGVLKRLHNECLRVIEGELMANMDMIGFLKGNLKNGQTLSQFFDPTDSRYSAVKVEYLIRLSQKDVVCVKAFKTLFCQNRLDSDGRRMQGKKLPNVVATQKQSEGIEVVAIARRKGSQDPSVIRSDSTLSAQLATEGSKNPFKPRSVVHLPKGEQLVIHKFKSTR